MDLKPGKKWDCPKCSKVFKTKQHLNRHISSHDADAKIKCEICGRVLKNPNCFDVNKVHTNRKRPNCDICHQDFFNAAGLRRHLRTAHVTKERPRIPCGFPGCAKTYQNKDDRSWHVKSEHTENPVRFPCKLCGRETKTRSELERHIATHTTEKYYNCATCGKSFPRSFKLKLHEVTHLDKSAREILRCQLCPRTFLSSLGLRLHIQVEHENRRDYPCAVCDKRFATATYLRYHVDAKHPANKEAIPPCDKPLSKE